MPRSPKVPCADCGKPVWSTLPVGSAVCHPCRRLNPRRANPKSGCIDCGTPAYGERCRSCRDINQRVRSSVDPRVRRGRREIAAPGLNSTARRALLASWIRLGRSCFYCSAPATSLDHVIPLVRGGTNYEGNLVPCCLRCNSSKAARLLVEWRNGRSPARATPTLRVINTQIRATPRGKKIKVCGCPICGSLFRATRVTQRMCGQECVREWRKRAVREKYRAEQGLKPTWDRPTRGWTGGRFAS